MSNYRMTYLWKSNQPVSSLLSWKTDTVIVRIIPEPVVSLWSYNYMGKANESSYKYCTTSLSQKMKKIVNSKNRKILLLFKRAFY